MLAVPQCDESIPSELYFCVVLCWVVTIFTPILTHGPSGQTSFEEKIWIRWPYTPKSNMPERTCDIDLYMLVYRVLTPMPVHRHSRIYTVPQQQLRASPD